MIDKEVKALIDRAFEMATTILTEHREGLVELAELLLEKEVVFTEDVERIFGKRKKDLEREAEEAAAEAKKENSEVSATEETEVEESAETTEDNNAPIYTIIPEEEEK